MIPSTSYVICTSFVHLCTNVIPLFRTICNWYFDSSMLRLQLVAFQPVALQFLSQMFKHFCGNSCSTTMPWTLHTWFSFMLIPPVFFQERYDHWEYRLDMSCDSWYGRPEVFPLHRTLGEYCLISSPLRLSTLDVRFRRVQLAPGWVQMWQWKSF